MKFLMLTFTLLLSTIFSSAYAAEPVWVDVRSAAEFSGGAVEGAVNIPHNVIAEEIGKVVADKDTQINLYCRSGRRAGWAMESLNQLGYGKVTNYGGYEAAKAAYQKQ